MDPEDQEVSDGELGDGNNEEEKLAGGDGDGAKAEDLVNAAERETNPNPAQNLKICDFCGKSFASGKALGGHRRSHFQVLKAQSRLKNKAKNQDSDHHLASKDKTCSSAANMNICTDHMPRDEKKHTCCLCGKDFPSMKSLSGHMRSHPGRVWKGILPPPTFSPPLADALAPPQSEEKSCSSNSTSSALGEYHDDIHGDGYRMMNPTSISNVPASIPVDLLKDLSEGMRWNATAKRGRKSIGAVAAAESLVHLSRGKYLSRKINNHGKINKAGKIPEFSSAMRRRRGTEHVLATDHNEKHKVKKIRLICRGVESVLLGDKACEEGGNLFNSTQQNMGNAHEEAEAEVENDKKSLKKESKNPVIEEGTKKSSKQIDGISESSKKKMKKKKNKKMSRDTDSYECGRCSKTFPTFQALGGHRSSHKKDSNCMPLMDEEKAPINEAKESESIEICNTVTEEANQNGKAASGEATQSSGKMLGIDLNLPYTLEDEGRN